MLWQVTLVVGGMLLGTGVFLLPTVVKQREAAAKRIALQEEEARVRRELPPWQVMRDEVERQKRHKNP